MTDAPRRGAKHQRRSRVICQGFPCLECPRMLRVFDSVGSPGDLRLASPGVWPSRSQNAVGIPVRLISELNGWPASSPVTLRLRPCDRLRMTRGRCGSLLLHRVALASTTPCRSPGALGVHQRPSADRLSAPRTPDPGPRLHSLRRPALDAWRGQGFVASSPRPPPRAVCATHPAPRRRRSDQDSALSARYDATPCVAVIAADTAFAIVIHTSR